jgi:hypothetical protein
MVLLAMTLAAWMPLPVVVSLLILATAAFGLVAPNAMEGAMQPLPQIAGAAGAATGRGPGNAYSSLLTHRWSETDSNPRSPVSFLASLSRAAPRGRCGCGRR